jgi:hypothetical protein
MEANFSLNFTSYTLLVPSFILIETEPTVSPSAFFPLISSNFTSLTSVGISPPNDSSLIDSIDMIGACSSTGAALFNVNFLGAKLPLLSFSINSVVDL